MSRRNRRQQEELQDLQAASGLASNVDQRDGQAASDEEEQDEYVPQASSSKFAAVS